MVAQQICGKRLATGGICTKPVGCTDQHDGPDGLPDVISLREVQAHLEAEQRNELLPVVQNLIDALEAFKQAIQTQARTKL